eukprot:UN19018
MEYVNSVLNHYITGTDIEAHELGYAPETGTKIISEFHELCIYTGIIFSVLFTISMLTQYFISDKGEISHFSRGRFILRLFLGGAALQLILFYYKFYVNHETLNSYLSGLITPWIASGNRNQIILWFKSGSISYYEYR